MFKTIIISMFLAHVRGFSNQCQCSKYDVFYDDLQNNGYFVEKWDVYHNNQKIDEAKSSSFKVLADSYAKIFVV